MRRVGTIVAFRRRVEEWPMKLIIAGFAVAAVSAVGLGAQSDTIASTGKTKIEVKDAKEITVTGCLERNPGGGLMLTNVANGRSMRYMLVTDNDDSKQFGRRVEVKGIATDEGEGKVKIQNTVKTSGNREAKATTEAKGD